MKNREEIYKRLNKIVKLNQSNSAKHISVKAIIKSKDKILFDYWLENGLKSFKEFDSKITFLKSNNEKNALELISECHNRGYIPSQQEVETKYSSILNKVNSKNLSYLTGLPTKKQFIGHKENGYWTNFKNVKREINNIIEKIDRFPSYAEIPNIGSIEQYWKFSDIVKKMGCENYYKSDYNEYFSSKNCVNTFCALKSLYEKAVHAFLIYNNINHIADGKIEKKSSFRYDFKIIEPEIFVEIWGAKKDNKTSKFWEYYNFKRDKKTNDLYKNKTLIEIEGSVLVKLLNVGRIRKQYEYLENIFKDFIKIKRFNENEYLKCYNEFLIPKKEKELLVKRIRKLSSKFFNEKLPPCSFLEEKGLRGKIKRYWKNLDTCANELGVEREFDRGYKNNLKSSRENFLKQYYNISLYSKGYKHLKNRNLKKPFLVRLAENPIGYFENKIDAFVAHKIASRLFYIKKINDFEKIRRMSKNSIRHSSWILKILQKDKTLKNIMIKEDII